MAVKIYLSPANHTKNGCVDNYKEKEQMEKVAKKVQSILSNYDCIVYYPTKFYDPNKDGNFIDGNYIGRPEEAKALGADSYCSIHSNAGGGKATGCCTFYHPNSTVGKSLATKFQEKLDSICPIPSNRHSSMKVINGMVWNGSSLGEIREPYNLGLTSVLIETNFHDTPSTCRWILDNIDKIAQAIADVLISFYGLKKKSTTTTIPSYKLTPENINKLVAAGVINTPDHWFTVNHQYLNELCEKSLPTLNFRVNNGVTNITAAMKVLTMSKVIDTPEYWLESMKKVKYLDQLLINMANRSRDPLERIVFAEAGGEDKKGQVLIADVIRNRARCTTGFPNTIYDVINQPGQFAPVTSANYSKLVVSDMVKDSVSFALAGTYYSRDALYFRAIKGMTPTCWHETALKKLFDHGGHRFYTNK